MVKIEKSEVFNFEGALRGMRNPMNSWNNSDSKIGNGKFIIGKNDLELAQRLVRAGTDHSKFMRMITVCVDITAPLYWWKEFDTYKVGTVANSCSTMHKITKKEFAIDDFSCEHLISMTNHGSYDPLLFLGRINKRIDSIDILELIVNVLNHYRKKYIDTKDKLYWWQMIQLLPSSYNQKRTVTMNYAVLRNIYLGRMNHKLDEWVAFCKWIEGLPYAKELICLGSKK